MAKTALAVVVSGATIALGAALAYSMRERPAPASRIEAHDDAGAPGAQERSRSVARAAVEPDGANESTELAPAKERTEQGSAPPPAAASAPHPTLATEEACEEHYRSVIAARDSADLLPCLLTAVNATATPENRGKVAAGHVIRDLVKAGKLSPTEVRVMLQDDDLDPAVEYALAVGAMRSFDETNPEFAFLAADIEEVFRRTSDAGLQWNVVVRIASFDTETGGGRASRVLREALESYTPGQKWALGIGMGFLNVVAHHPSQKPEVVDTMVRYLERDRDATDRSARFFAAEALWLIAPEELEVRRYDPWFARKADFFRDHGAPNLGGLAGIKAR